MSVDPPHDLRDYYARRTLEYERIYTKPERQADLAEIRARVAQHCRHVRVLEIACGTGYWTRGAAAAAQALTATDAVPDVLEYARLRQVWPSSVRFAIADAYHLRSSSRIRRRSPYDAAFAGFWLSHVPRARVVGFLSGLNAVLRPGAAVLLFDNRYVEGSSTPLAFADPAGDTYQRRSLADGSEHDVLKNFFEARELVELAGAATGVAPDSIVVDSLAHHWVLTFRTAT
jgi:SAM-dependent methyltransferase